MDPIKYQRDEHKQKLSNGFQSVAEWAAKKATLAEMNGEDAKALRTAADSAYQLGHLIMASPNPARAFVSSPALKDQFGNVITVLNDMVLAKPEGDPDRCNPTVRAAMRRMDEFLIEMADNGNCAKFSVIKGGGFKYTGRKLH